MPTFCSLNREVTFKCMWAKFTCIQVKWGNLPQNREPPAQIGRVSMYATLGSFCTLSCSDGISETIAGFSMRRCHRRHFLLLYNVQPHTAKPCHAIYSTNRSIMRRKFSLADWCSRNGSKFSSLSTDFLVSVSAINFSIALASPSLAWPPFLFWTPVEMFLLAADLVGSRRVCDAFKSIELIWW